MKVKWLVLAWLALVVVAGQANALKLTPDLQAQLDKAAPGDMIECIVMLGGYDYDAVAGLKPGLVIRQFKAESERSQSSMVKWLAARKGRSEVVRCYWAMNGLFMRAESAVIREMAERPEVGMISHNGTVSAPVEPAVCDSLSGGAKAAEWGIKKVMADSCWAAGYTGQGVIIGLTDTGVDYLHPALAGKFEGHWFDAINGQTTPYDDMTNTWHGSHCMGTILGGDGLGPFADDVGMAPGARFVAAKVLNSAGSGTWDQCLAGLQFMANLKDSIDIRAVSNSWGGSAGPDTAFLPVCRTLKAVGILVIFSNGNSGPNPGTVGVPGNHPNVLGVGNTDNTDAINNGSSRGPAPDQAPFNVASEWWRPDQGITKPQISAPGTNIRSVKGDGSNTYHNLTGTSMSTPHVVGAVALLCSKNPNLTPLDLYNLLLDNADQPMAGEPYPNNNYGWGRLNVWKALKATPTSNQPYIVLTAQSITDPLPGGNDNGRLDPGEQGQMTVTVRNNGGVNGANTTAKLIPLDNYLTVSNGTASFGTLTPQQSANNNSSPYLINVHSLTPQGHQAKLGLVLHADGPHDSLDYDNTIEIMVTIGAAPAPYTIYFDDFEYGGGLDSLLNYWTVSANWARSNEKSHSTPYSLYNGNVKGAYEVRLKNGVDLRLFADPKVGFWQTHNFDDLWVEAFAEVSTDGGSNWSELWKYKWISDPDSIPWSERILSLAGYKSANVQIRYRVKTNNLSKFQRWFIDDFKIFAAPDNEPPYFANTTRLGNTASLGPFLVQSTVTDITGIHEVKLYWRANGGSWQSLNMTAGKGLYQGSIPAQTGTNVNVDYYLWGDDTWITPNAGADPVGSPSGTVYSFVAGMPSSVGFGLMTASEVEEGIAVEWETLSESGAYQWEVSRSNGGEYAVEGIVTASGAGRYRYLDQDQLETGVYNYRLTEVDLLGRRTIQGEVSLDYSSRQVPVRYELQQSAPNPTKGQTAIRYQLPKSGNVSLKIYNTLGQAVQTLVNQNQKPGYYCVNWNGKDDNGRQASSGIYFYRFVSRDYNATKRLLVLR